MRFRLLLALGFSGILGGCGGPQPIPVSLQPGTRLAYTVTEGTAQYPFLVDVEQFGPPLIFQYTLDPGGRRLTGRVTVAPLALTGATRQVNRFGGGDLMLDDATTVWVSQAVHGALREGSEIAVDFGMGEGAETLRFVEEVPFAVQHQGEPLTLDALHAVTDDGDALWVWDYPQQPLILQLESDFSVTLEEIW